MRVAIYGPSGMLGKHVVRALKERDHVAIPMYRQMTQEFRQIMHSIEEQQVDAVINCAGLIPTRGVSPIDMIRDNAILPHLLAQTGKPIIHVSTDCVFSGRNRYRYKPEDIPDPRDYYGKTKSMGEVAAPNVLNVRTSFIGCEHGFMNWIFNVARSTTEPKTISGYKGALWSGSTVQAVASSLVDMLGGDRHGVCHLATSQVITKYDLACKLIELNEFDIQVEPVYHPIINRALLPTVELQDIDTALVEYKCAGTINARNNAANLQPA